MMEMSGALTSANVTIEKPEEMETKKEIYNFDSLQILILKLGSETKPDIEVVVIGKNSTGKIMVHGWMLSGRSFIFNDLVRHLYTQRKHSMCIELVNLEPEIFGEIIKYLYTGIGDINFQKYGFELLWASNKFLMLELRDICKKYLYETFNKFISIIKEDEENKLEQIKKYRKLVEELEEQQEENSSLTNETEETNAQ